MRKRFVLALVGASLVLGAAAAPALAHDHSLTTPGGKVVCLSDPQEQADPSNGAMAAGNPHVPDDMVGGGTFRGHHPMHWFLHIGPASQGNRAITLTVGCAT